MLTGFFQDSDFIVVLQTGFGSGFLPLGSGLESDLKNLSPNTSGMKLCYKLKMHRGIDGMFAFSSGLCSWINKDSRICSRRQLLSLPMTCQICNTLMMTTGVIETFAMVPWLFRPIHLRPFIWDHSFETTFIWDHIHLRLFHLRLFHLRLFHLRPHSFETTVI